MKSQIAATPPDHYLRADQGQLLRIDVDLDLETRVVAAAPAMDPSATPTRVRSGLVVRWSLPPLSTAALRAFVDRELRPVADDILAGFTRTIEDGQVMGRLDATGDAIVAGIAEAAEALSSDAVHADDCDDLASTVSATEDDGTLESHADDVIRDLTGDGIGAIYGVLPLLERAREHERDLLHRALEQAADEAESAALARDTLIAECAQFTSSRRLAEITGLSRSTIQRMIGKQQPGVVLGAARVAINEQGPAS